MHRVYRMVPGDQLKPNPRNARTHPQKQVREIAASIEAFGFTAPIITDENGKILAGHARYAAAQSLCLPEIPVVELHGLSDAKKRALAIADNKLASKAGWDRERLAIELPELSDLLVGEGLDLTITGFDPVEIDQLQTDFEENSTDPADEVDPAWSQASSVSKLGDLWVIEKHRLLCADARDPAALHRVMDRGKASAAFLDPPYNVFVRSIVGRGRIKHREFAMASGEMSAPEYNLFLTASLRQAASVSTDGAVHFVCIDWKHVADLVRASEEVYGEMLNLVVWAKTNGGQGSFYRSQHELIGVFRVGSAPHLNNVELGRHGRNRSNVWRYSGVNSFGTNRLDELKLHPTVKPVSLVADAIKDCTRRGDIILDTFCGSGTTILAAQRVGRRGYGVEIDPAYVDVTIRRLQAFTGRDAVLATSGVTFDELAAKSNTLAAPRRLRRRSSR